MGNAPFDIRHRFGVNLFAVRQASKASVTRLRSHRFAAGDVVLLQGWGKNLASSVAELGVLPLADRKLNCNRMRFPTSLSMLSGRWKNAGGIVLQQDPRVALPHHLEFDDGGTGHLRIDASNGDTCLYMVPTVTRSSLLSTGALSAPGMWSSANSSGVRTSTISSKSAR